MHGVVALAGRRVDADLPGGAVRFPGRLVPIVRERIRALLAGGSAASLVCSAACGADLLALEAAGRLGLRRRVVLPFTPDRFRGTSVTDRPGAWGDLYDDAIGAVLAAGDLVVLNEVGSDDDAYAATTRAILDEAQALAARAAPAGQVSAVIVWDGSPRGPGDLTAGFADEARTRGIPVSEISTLE